jgi:mRNA interferase HigB
MLVIRKKKLDDFSLKNAIARKSIATWKKATEEASWKNRRDILITFPNAKILVGNRVRFEIVHNKFRLIAEVYYEQQIVDVRFIGTHNQYERINPETI